MSDYNVSLPDYTISEKYSIGARSGRLYSWGRAYLKAEDVHGVSDGAGAVAFVIDTEDFAFNPLLTFVPEYCARFTDEDSSVNSAGGHGLHVSDTLQQIAPGAAIGLIKGLRNEGVGYDSWIEAAIRYAVDLELNREHSGWRKVINLSLGSDTGSSRIRSAIEYARSKDVYVFAAAGNGGNQVDFPGAFGDIVITSAAIDRNGVAAWFSDRGPEVDVASPGVDIVAAYKDGQAALNGTSMACPHTAGIGCLIIGRDPEADLESVIKGGATDIDEPGFDERTGAGVPIATGYFKEPEDPEDPEEPEEPGEPEDPNDSLPTWVYIAVGGVILAALAVALFFN